MTEFIFLGNFMPEVCIDHSRIQARLTGVVAEFSRQYIQAEKAQFTSDSLNMLVMLFPYVISSLKAKTPFYAHRSSLTALFARFEENRKPDQPDKAEYLKIFEEALVCANKLAVRQLLGGESPTQQDQSDFSLLTADTLFNQNAHIPSLESSQLPPPANRRVQQLAAESNSSSTPSTP